MSSHAGGRGGREDAGGRGGREDADHGLAGIRHGYADLEDVRLHYVEAGKGPLVVLLHGFPEFWFGWRRQIPAVAAAGFRVVAPDMRGYNLSSRPRGVSAYDLNRLAADVAGLIAERGAERACVAGHDWGAAVAWWTAIVRPETVERLAILNVPHPRRFLRGLRDPRQLARSWYIGFFQLPWLPERLVAAGDYRALRMAFADARAGAFAPEEMDEYVEAWSQPGALTAAINYYRALSRRSPARTARELAPVRAPTLVIWGVHDRVLGEGLAEPDHDDVPTLEDVVRLDASHWVQLDEPERVNQLLIEFFARVGAS
jgi:pimeloyl-ACP methyl ester carboxylesterase